MGGSLYSISVTSIAPTSYTWRAENLQKIYNVSVQGIVGMGQESLPILSLRAP